MRSPVRFMLMGLLCLLLEIPTATMLPAQNPAADGTPAAVVSPTLPRPLPRQVRFSGVLQNGAAASPGSGATWPTDGTPAGVTFALYKEQTGGAPLWIETQ